MQTSCDDTDSSDNVELRARKNAVLRMWAQRTPKGTTMVGPVGEVLERLVDFMVGRDSAAEALSAAVQAHVLERFRDGFTIDAVVGEYALLRRCIQLELGNRRFDYALDVAVGQAAKHFLAFREELRERFIGVLAHDLRSPLACVAMANEMLLTEERSDSERSLIELVLDSSERMRRMVNEVLSWARGNVGNHAFPINKRPEDLAAILRDVLAETHVVHGENSLTLETDGEMRGDFDRDRIYQAVTNLVRNAIEHGTGTAHISASEADKGQTIVMVVRNRGALRSPAASHVGDPFMRRSRPSESRGLGLYIVDQITRAHGGSVDMTTNLEETTITIRWPTGRVVDDMR